MIEQDNTLELPEQDNTFELAGIPASDFLLQFHDVDNNNEEVGKFYLEDGKLKFVGDTDKSAKLFVETVLGMYNAELDSKCCSK